MSWIELHDSITDHRKIRALARELGIPVAYAIGHLACLWTRTLRLAADGDLTDSTIEDIEYMASWEGVPGHFVKCATSVGLLDKSDIGYSIHSWEDYSAKWKARIRKREQRSKNQRNILLSQDKQVLSQDNSGTSQDRGASNGTVTGSDRSDQTRPERPDNSAREDFSTSKPEPNPEPESVPSFPAKPSSSATAVASTPTTGYSPSPEVPAGNPEALRADFNLTDLDRLISEARKCAKLGPYIARVTTYTKRSEAVDEIKAIAVERKLYAADVARRALRNFYSAKDDWLIEHKYPIGSFCADVGRWFDPPETKSEDEGGENYRYHMALRKASDEWIEKEREYDKQLAAEQREGGNGGNHKPTTSIRGDPEKIKNVLDVVGLPPEIIKAQKELEEKRKVKGNV